MSGHPGVGVWTGASLFAKWHPIVEFYHVHAIKFYLVMLIKNLLFILAEKFERLGWLDCLLPGRPLIGSRIPQASLYLGLFAWLYLIANKLLLDHLGLDFSLFCLEFAIHLHKQLGRVDWWPRGQRQADGRAASATCRRLPSKCPSVVREMFTSKLDGSRLLRRPTRTPARMKAYSIAHLMSLVSLLVGLLTGLIVCMLMLAPMLITRRGFERTRESCVRFVSAQRIEGGASTGYEFIYEAKSSPSPADILPHQPLPFILPYSDVLALNFYHLLRITSDLFEILLTFAFFGFGLWFNLYFVIAFSTDALIYARYLNQRLAKTALQLNRMRCESSPTSMPSDSDPWRPFVSGQSRESRRELACTNSIQLQGSICDYFDMIAYYNSFVSVTTLINILLWLFYSFLVLARTIRVGRLETVGSLDGGVQIEFVTLYAGVTLILALMLSTTSLLNSDASRLYTAIVRVMLLERGSELSKKRWVSLLNHFHPERLHCFSLFNHTDLSWLFCVKIFAWGISALVILMSL